MRYARHLVSLIAAFGLAGVAQARPQEEEEQEEQNQNQNQNQEAPPMCCEEVPQPYQPPQYQYPQYTQPAPRKHHRMRYQVFSPSQVAIVVGGGGADFMSENLSTLVHPGAMWNARLTLGAHSWLAVEAAYIGTMNKLVGALPSEPQIMSNGFEGDVRINFWPGRVQPYAFGGVGYVHWSLHNRDHNPAVAAIFNDSDNQLVVPAGAGLTGFLGNHFLIDTRFTYRALFNQNFIINVNEDRMDQWTVQANLGVAF